MCGVFFLLYTISLYTQTIWVYSILFSVAIHETKCVVVVFVFVGLFRWLGFFVVEVVWVCWLLFFLGGFGGLWGVGVWERNLEGIYFCFVFVVVVVFLLLCCCCCFLFIYLFIYLL